MSKDSNSMAKNLRQIILNSHGAGGSAELSTSTSWTAAFEFSSPLVLLHYLMDRVRLPLVRVELFARLTMIGA